MINNNIAAARLFPDTTQKTIEAVERAGFTVNLVQFPNARATALLKSNQIDGDVFRLESYQEVAPDARPVPFATQTLNIVAVVKADSTIETLDDLGDKRLATVRGAEVYNYVATLMEKDFVALDTFDQAFRFIELGRADFTLLTPEIVESDITTGYDFRYLEEPVIVVPFYLWLHKKHEAKFPAIQRELEAIFQSDTHSPS